MERFLKEISKLSYNALLMDMTYIYFIFSEVTVQIQNKICTILQENVACRPKNYKKVGTLVEEDQGMTYKMVNRKIKIK